MTLHFARWEDKALYLCRAAERDAADPTIAALGRAFARAYPDEYARAVALHRWVRDSIRYRRDPPLHGRPREQFASAARVLAKGSDDCDGKARLFVAAARAAGLWATILPYVRGGEFVHVQASVRLAGRWVLAELILRGVELGQGIEAAQRDASGAPIYA